MLKKFVSSFFTVIAALSLPTTNSSAAELSVGSKFNIPAHVYLTVAAPYDANGFTANVGDRCMSTNEASLRVVSVTANAIVAQYDWASEDAWNRYLCITKILVAVPKPQALEWFATDIAKSDKEIFDSLHK